MPLFHCSQYWLSKKFPLTPEISKIQPLTTPLSTGFWKMRPLTTTTSLWILKNHWLWESLVGSEFLTQPKFLFFWGCFLAQNCLFLKKNRYFSSKKIAFHLTRLRLCATLVENYYHLASKFATLPFWTKNHLPKVLGGSKFEEILPKLWGIHPEIFSFLPCLKK